MTNAKEQVIGIVQSMPESKVIYILDILRGLNGLWGTDVEEQQPIDQSQSVMGIFSKYANPDLIPLEKDAWRNAAVEKHANY